MLFCGSRNGRNYLFWSANNGVYELVAINCSTGAQKWAVPVGGQIEGSPAIGTDGTIYVDSDNGTLYAFNPCLAYGLRILPSSVKGGNSGALAVYLNGVAGPGGTVVTLRSANSDATLPATITVP